MPAVRNLVVVFGDQLDAGAAAFDGYDPDRDAVWMAEARAESTHVWSAKQRIAVFLAAMRHFRNDLRTRGYRVEYTQLDDRGHIDTLQERLAVDLRSLRPERVVTTRPGEWRVLNGVEGVCTGAGIPLDLREDRHFFTTPEEFRNHAEGRKSLRMENFYRNLRKRFRVLMDGDEPAGGRWNYDAENRDAFGHKGPRDPGGGPGHRPDSLTREVQALVNDRFADHPGQLDRFPWPVTRKEALRDLRRFLTEHLLRFGRFQDAMWADEPYLYHSLLSTSLNRKLLHPREVVQAAEAAYRDGNVPLAAAEGFIRQVLGWREYVRGIYWLRMPGYMEHNEMGAKEELPDFYWTGETGLECLRQVIGQTLEHGYAHHIQRLMVTGLYPLLLGVRPKQVHEWYLAVYVDAVEWVELPNVLGMSQYADGGLMASKPYVATGKYIRRMSNYCARCPKDPDRRTGSEACPFTTLYWDFLLRHRDMLKKNPRMALQLRNLDRLNRGERSAVARAAHAVRRDPAVCRPDFP